MKPIKFSPGVVKKLQDIKKSNTKLSSKIQKQLMLFQENPRHPSLRLHKITREVENSWSISIDMSIRMIYTETDEEIYFYEIGTHEEVYR